jgi:hypothetical protein
MLIEIRRIDANCVGAQEPSIGILKARNGIKKRNSRRHFIIEWNQKDSCRGNSIRFNDRQRYCPTIIDPQGTVGLVQCAPVQRFFHELLHKFHFLRHMDRHDDEKTGFTNDDLLGTRSISCDFFIGLDEDNRRKKVSSLPWGEWNIVSYFLNEERIRLNVEEFRTICGVSADKRLFPNCLAVYLEGDDLSENLFLCSIGRPLRFGHEKVPFIEDKSVITKAMSIVSSNRYYNVPMIVFPSLNDAIRPAENGPLHGVGTFVITLEDARKKIAKEWD